MMASSLTLEAKQNDPEFEYLFLNTPPNLVAPFKHFAYCVSQNIYNNLQIAINNIDMVASMYYVRSLSAYLDLQYPLTKKMRICIFKLCSKLLFEIPTDLSQQSDIMALLCDLIENEQDEADLIHPDQLQLDWKPFYNLLISVHYSCKNGAILTDEKCVFDDHAQQIAALIKASRHYFKQESVAQILDQVLPYFNTNDIYYTRSISLLYLFLPIKQKWVHEELINYKMYTDRKKGNVPDLLLFFLHQILHEKRWSDFIPFKLIQILTNFMIYHPQIRDYFRQQSILMQLFHCFCLHSEVPINGYCCPLDTNDYLNEGIFGGCGHPTISAVVDFLVYLMNDGGDNDIVTQLFIKYFKNVTNYFHPDEPTATTTNLKLILAQFAKTYSKRYWIELRGYDSSSWHAKSNHNSVFYREMEDKYKLSVSSNLLTVLLPILKFSIYSKSSACKQSGYDMIKRLSTVYPQRICVWAVAEIEECLDITAIAQSHRLLIGISLLSCITPTLLNRSLCPSMQPKIIKFLKIILFGIDPSISKQCSMTMRYLDTIFRTVPIIKAKASQHCNMDDTKMNGNSDCLYDDKIGIQCTYEFESFALSFCDKILSFSRDTYSVPKQFLCCINSFWFALSESIYIQCRDKVLNGIISEPQHGAIGGSIISKMIAPHPELSAHLILAKIICKMLYPKNQRNEENEYDDIQSITAMNRYEPQLYEFRGSKDVLLYYLKLLQNAISVTHSYIISYMPILCNIVTICINNSLPEIQRFAAPIVLTVVTTLARIVPCEFRSFSPDLWNENGSWKHWRVWGQFSEIEMRNVLKSKRVDLKLKWFTPTQKEFNAIQRLMDYVLTTPLQQMDDFINKNGINGDHDGDDRDAVKPIKAEKLSQYVRILQYLCYGLGHLGDFTVDKDSEIIKPPQKVKAKSNLYKYIIPTDHNHKTFGEFNKLRSILTLPYFEQYKNISLRTALTRLTIRLYQKLSEYAEKEDYDAIVPEDSIMNLNIDNANSKSKDISISMDMENKQQIEDEDELAVECESMSSSAKSKQYSGVSKVLYRLNLLTNLLLNVDGIVWSVIPKHSSNFKSKTCWDLLNGHKYDDRQSYISEISCLTLKRLYYLLYTTSYTTDTQCLVNECIKFSISEFQHVRNQSIHALLSHRTIFNFKPCIEWAFRFWIKILRDLTSTKHELWGAMAALLDSALLTELILVDPGLHREFILTVLNCSMHREPIVQTHIFCCFLLYVAQNPYQTLFIPPALANNSDRQQELEMLNVERSQNYNRIHEELLSFITSGSDPLVSSLSQLISNLPFDVSQVALFDANNISAKTLSLFLQKQCGINIKSKMLQSLTMTQIKSIIRESPFSKLFNNAQLQQDDDIVNNKASSSNNVHWKYQLMATILLWKSLRPNIAPNAQFVEYVLSLIGNQVPALNRIGCISLCVIINNYMPLLHYKDIIKDKNQYPAEHTFNCKDIELCNKLPLFMTPRAILSHDAALTIHNYLSQNLKVLCRALSSDHPLINDDDQSGDDESQMQQLVDMIEFYLSWPYNGFNVCVASWEETHWILIRDILRAKWPNHGSDDAESAAEWKCDYNLWPNMIDLFNLHVSNFKEKKDQIVGCEILAGIMRAYHHFTAIQSFPFPNGINIDYLSENITKPLIKIFNSSPQESQSMICSALRTATYNADISYLKWFIHPILSKIVSNMQVLHRDEDEDDAKKETFISPAVQTRSVRYASYILASFTFRCENEWKYILSAMMTKQKEITFELGNEHKIINALDDYAVFDCFFGNQYDQTRSKIGFLLFSLLKCFKSNNDAIAQQQPLTIYDCTQSHPLFTSLINVIECRYFYLWHKQNENPKEKNEKKENTKKYERLLETICYWFIHCESYANVIYYETLFVRFLPLILYGSHRENKELRDSVECTLEIILWTQFHESFILDIFKNILDTNRKPKLINNSKWQIRKGVLEFLLKFIARNCMVLDMVKNENYKTMIIDYLVNYSLIDEQVEVRSTARNVLTALIQTTNLKHPQEINKLLLRFEKLCKIKVPKRDYNKKEKLNKTKLRKKHGGILGLTSIVLVSPYSCPNYLPQILSVLSLFDRERAPISNTVRQTISEFKRTHHDEWHVFKKQFNAEQLANIQDASCSLHSYFV